MARARQRSANAMMSVGSRIMNAAIRAEERDGTKEKGADVSARTFQALILVRRSARGHGQAFRQCLVKQRIHVVFGVTRCAGLRP